MNKGCYYFDNIIASVGWNKNLEYFLAEELWLAKDTCIDEPLNFQHEEFKIVGHTISAAIGLGNPREDDFQILPIEETAWENVQNGFHLINKDALYRDYWREDEQIMYIEQLIQEIKDNKWFVSLECYPERFDFVLEKDNTVKFIEFNDNTAFLARYLKQYGGEGEFNGYKLGRLLRNFKFVGKGLVRNPANPDSIILSSETNMENKAELEAAKTELENVKAELDSTKQIAANKTAEVSTLTASVKTLNDEKVALVADKTAISTELETVKAELANIKAETELAKKYSEEKDVIIASLTNEINTFKLTTRTNQLVAAGLSKEEADKTVAALANLNDENFSVILASYKKPEQSLSDNVTPNKEVVLAASNTVDKLSEIKESTKAFFSRGAE